MLITIFMTNNDDNNKNISINKGNYNHKPDYDTSDNFNDITDDDDDDDDNSNNNNNNNTYFKINEIRETM